ncbi:MAG: NYN domain-containing protein [Candidatus Eiseniibacteriota bacterium]|jgi:uncharacterized LabA/DUF88 family protein
MTGEQARKLALFIDFENIAMGLKRARAKQFQIDLVLERLLEKGKIITKRAYADWERFSEYKRPFHEAAIELIEIPQRQIGGKNSADIKLVVDALDLSYAKEHIDTFVIASGDSDFSPLVSKLKENDRYVIGVGVRNSTSELLLSNCDEFIFYEDLERPTTEPESETIGSRLPKRKQEAFTLVVDAVRALEREGKQTYWASMVKETIKRKRPSFNEGYHGYDSFSDLLEDAEASGVIEVTLDEPSGSYIVTNIVRKKRSRRRSRT